MKIVTKRELTTLAMVAGGELKHPRVIICDHVMQWVGFGWINEGKADYNDRATLPVATEE